ncbi:MAG: hypothetical protein Q8R54_00770, partial [Methylobacter sp.]|nr:hypothetical protein [Methylobacter sp.]
MTDKRNIVIKVSYPVSGKATENETPRMLTEWNVKRILLAAGVLVVMLAALIYGINYDTQKTDVDNTAALVNEPEISVTSPVEVKDGEINNLVPPKQAAEETNPPVKSKHEPNDKAASTQVKEVIKKQPKEKVNQERGYSKVNPNVPRALLTYAINNKEPAGEIVKAVEVSHKK